jgi:hypothetical protein
MTSSGSVIAGKPDSTPEREGFPVLVVSNPGSARPRRQRPERVPQRWQWWGDCGIEAAQEAPAGEAAQIACGRREEPQMLDDRWELLVAHGVARLSGVAAAAVDEIVLTGFQRIGGTNR